MTVIPSVGVLPLLVLLGLIAAVPRGLLLRALLILILRRLISVAAG